MHFTPDVERKLNAIAKQMGRPAPELVQDAVAGYVSENNPPMTISGAERRRTHPGNTKARETRSRSVGDQGLHQLWPPVNDVICH